MYWSSKGKKTVYWLSLATFLIKSKEESIYGTHQLHFIHFAAIYIGLSRWLRIQRIRERGHPRQNFVRDLLGDGMYLLDTQLQRSSQINSHGLLGGCCRRGEGRGQMGQFFSRSGRVKGEARKCQGGRCVRRGGDCGSATAALLQECTTIDSDYLLRPSASHLSERMPIGR